MVGEGEMKRTSMGLKMCLDVSQAPWYFFFYFCSLLTEYYNNYIFVSILSRLMQILQKWLFGNVSGWERKVTWAFEPCTLFHMPLIICKHQFFDVCMWWKAGANHVQTMAFQSSRVIPLYSSTIMSRFSKIAFTDLYINQQAVACKESINTCEISQERGWWVKGKC